MIRANDPQRKSWIDVPENSDFTIQNVPFGIFKPEGAEPRACTRIGDTVIDLSLLAEKGYFDGANIKDRSYFHQNTLNNFIALGREVARDVRNIISDLFSEENDEIRKSQDLRGEILYDANEVEMLMPLDVGDYTDFYSSIEHATNVGTMFRDPENALMPNWKHLPVGYHGRASSIVVSGVPVHRPKGQTKPNDSEKPIFGPSKLLDFELEMAFITCKNTRLGESISIEKAEGAIWGMVLFNDWSARDIQKWEYVPLGPFLAKSFGSSISPWIVTMDALEPFKVAGPKQDPEVLPYLKYGGNKNYDINLEVYIEAGEVEPKKVCRSNFKYMYWNMAQQLTHQTVNGCNIRVGDIYASGTISGKSEDSYGSMLELTWQGTKPILMPDGSQRKFINDGDTVIMKGWAQKDDVRVGFGEVRTKVLPAV